MPIRRSHAKVAVGLFWVTFLVTFFKISTSISDFFLKVSVALTLVTLATIDIFCC